MNTRKIIRSAFRVLSTVAAVLVVVWLVVAQPTIRSNKRSAFHADPGRLKAHVRMLSETCHPRNFEHLENLDRCAEYIAGELRRVGAVVEFQEVKVGTRSYRNVIGKFRGGSGPKLVVGAHYDSCYETPGADDNASGVAALIELAGLIGKDPRKPNVELVAYVLEEPPFFSGPNMGSCRHAERLRERGEVVKGVIVLEMVGTFSDELFSQRYPMLLLRLMYPARANFIGVVGRMDQGDWIKTVKVAMKGATDLPVYSIRGPAALPGIDLSDHRCYWAAGYKAVMITDTAFYRTGGYHKPTDTYDRLDYKRMADVVVAVFEAVGGGAGG